jgi:hypothetical protein
MIAQFGARSLPTGKHVANLVEIGELAGKFGDPALKIVFEVLEGKFAGFQAKKVIGLNFAPDTSAGEFITQLVGRPLDRGDSVDLNSLVNQSFELSVSGAQILKVTPVIR